MRRYIMNFFRGIRTIQGVHNDSNIYIVDNELIVDTGTGDFFPQLKEEMVRFVDKKRIKLIVNTHYHYDHTGGNKKFRDWLHAPLAIHHADKPYVEQGRTLANQFGGIAKITTMDRELNEGDVIETENFRFVVIHTPGHTAGSICLYELEQKILFSGDTLLGDKVGRADTPGGDYNELRFSLEKLADYNIQYLFPGHGAPRVGGTNFLIKKHLVTPVTDSAI